MSNEMGIPEKVVWAIVFAVAIFCIGIMVYGAIGAVMS